MYVSMHPNDVNTVFRLHALKLGDYYIGSKNYGYHDFIVPRGWNTNPACVEILKTLSEDQDRPISLVLGDKIISIDPVIGDELFDCLFAYTVIKDHQ